jgi:hypothetical protein
VTAVGLGVNTSLLDCWVVVATGVAFVVGTGVDMTGADSTGLDAAGDEATGVDLTGVDAFEVVATSVADVTGLTEPELPKFDPAVVLAPEETPTFLTMTTSPSILVTLTSTVVVPKPAVFIKKL